MHSTHCLNCTGFLTEKAKFCPSCGQKADIHRLSIGHIVHDGIHFFLHADKSFFTLAKMLATKTGLVAREFIEGKRKRYFPPLNFFLIVIGLMVLAMSLFPPLQKENKENNQMIQAVSARITDPVKKAKFLSLIKRQQNVAIYTQKYSNIFAMCALPLISLIFYLFYKRNKYNYAEHVIANLYSVGFTSLIMAFVFIPLMSFASARNYFIILGLYFIVEITYRSIYYTRLMGKTGAASYAKAAAVALLAQVLWISLSGGIMFWYIVSGIGGLFA